MADPLSLSTAVARLVGTATKCSITCRSLLTAHADAPQSLTTVNIESFAVKSTLSFIYGILSLNRTVHPAEFLPGSPLAKAFHITLTAASATFAQLDGFLQTLAQDGGGSTFGIWERKMGNKWDESAVVSIIEQMVALRPAVSTVLAALEIEDQKEMHNLLESRMSQFQTVEQGTRTSSSTRNPSETESTVIVAGAETKHPHITSDIREQVIHHMGMDNGQDRWDGTQSPSTPSLSSDSEPCRDSFGPATPQSSSHTGRGYELDNMSETPSERSWTGHTFSSRRWTGLLPTSKQNAVDSKRNGILELQVVEDSTFGSSMNATDKVGTIANGTTEPITLPPPIPLRSPRRHTLSSQKSYNFLPQLPPSPQTPIEPLPRMPLTRTTTSTSDFSSLYKSFHWPPPPTYTFTADQPYTPEPPKKFWRRSLSRKPSMARMLLNESNPGQPEAFYFQWIKPPINVTFSNAPEDAATSHSPGFTRSTVTIPLLGDPCVATKSASRRWVESKLHLQPQQQSRPSNNNHEEVSISGTASDGHTTRPLRATFCSINHRRQLEMLQQKRYSDASLAVLCFNIVDRSTLDNVLRKWSPSIRNNLPTILLGLSPDAYSLRPTHFEHNRTHNFFSADVLSSLNANSRSAGVTRAQGVAAAKMVGAVAYVECSEVEVGCLERLWSAVVGLGVVESGSRSWGESDSLGGGEVVGREYGKERIRKWEMDMGMGIGRVFEGGTRGEVGLAF